MRYYACLVLFCGTLHDTIIGSAEKHETKLIQHLGIVAGICKESRLAELIDERVEQPKRHVTVGQATVAMILRCGRAFRSSSLSDRAFFRQRSMA